MLSILDMTHDRYMILKLTAQPSRNGAAGVMPTGHKHYF